MGDAGRATIPYLERGVGAALAGMRKVFRKKNDRHRFTGARLAGRNHVDEAVARVVAAGEISARSYDLRAPDLHPLAVGLAPVAVDDIGTARRGREAEKRPRDHAEKPLAHWLPSPSAYIAGLAAALGYGHRTIWCGGFHVPTSIAASHSLGTSNPKPH